MSYFIEYIRTYANVNKKGMVLQEFVQQIENVLIPDELSLDALKSELKSAIETMNAKYPRTMPVYLTHAGAGNHFQWYIRVEELGLFVAGGRYLVYRCAEESAAPALAGGG